GAITFRDWHPVGAEEYGYAVPDPLDPDVIYGGKLSRYDRRTKQVQEIAPRPLREGGYRVIRTAPIAFSPVDPHILYFASNTLWKTTSGGNSWTEISPDLSRPEWTVPASVGVYSTGANARPTRRGVIYAIAPSPLDVNRIWAGTDDGLIHLTTDGGATWKNVTPPQLQAWMKVSIIDASHSDPQTAYVAVNTFRIDDLRPHIYRTRDGGATWSHITNGIPDAGIVNVVREDPKRKGLLFAGTEREVFVSFDDGDHWQSVRQNMPASSIRDLVIKDDDVVVATHGRGFWILDDIEPLRQIDATTSAAASRLFAPAVATRVRWNNNTDTPLPPEEPAGQNPPDGAMIDYYLRSAASSATLEILDGAGKVVRRYSSADKVAPVADTGNVPRYWIRPPQVLSTGAGMHRFLWDLHYTPARRKAEYPIAAVVHETAPSPTSPWVVPGTYTVRLTIDGQSETQPLLVKMDPRVRTSEEALEQQYSLSKEVYDALIATDAAIEDLHGMRHAKAASAAKGSAPNVTSQFERMAAALEGEESESSPVPGPPATLHTQCSSPPNPR
ncbi:MAG: glycoside hydrolase, partial [Acidobacteriota bacterium]